MIETIKKQFSHYLWDKKSYDLTIYQSFLLRLFRIFYGVMRDMSGGLPSLRAMGLVYTTLLSFVPLIAVSFSVLKGFGAHNNTQLKSALENILAPLGEQGIEVSQQIISFVDNMQVGVLGSVGLLALIFTVLSLVKKIESAFNYTWRISVTRNIFQRFSNYFSVIFLGPLLMFTAAGINASFNSTFVIEKYSAIEPLGSIILFAGEVVPYILTTLSFTLLYILIPNTKVKFFSAFYGAVITTIIWKIAATLFTAFIVNSTNYTAIYSGFAIMIIFMLWIYTAWSILLTGSAIAYYHQHPERIDKEYNIVKLSCRTREKLALTIMQLISCHFHNKKTPLTLKNLEDKTHVAKPALLMILSALHRNDLIATTGDDNLSYIPATSLENISIDMVLSAVRSTEEKQYKPDDIQTTAHVEDIITTIDNGITDLTKNKTLKDLI